MLLTDYYPRYMSEHEHLRECTLTGYESVWRLHCQPLAYQDMDELTLTRVQAWADNLPSPGVARKAWALVRAMLRSSHQRGLTVTSIDTVTLAESHTTGNSGHILSGNNIVAITDTRAHKTAIRFPYKALRVSSIQNNSTHTEIDVSTRLYTRRPLRYHRIGAAVT